MEVVLDYNVVFSALQKKGLAHELLALIVFSDSIIAIVPEYFWVEFEKHKEKLVRLSKLDEQDFEDMVEILRSEIISVPKEIYEKELETAKSICRDVKDAPYVALALHRDAPLVTGDRALREDASRAIKVYSPRELLEIVRGRKEPAEA